MKKMTFLLLFAGIGLSVYSLAEWCSSACSATHDYTLFGIAMGWVGIALFLMLSGCRIFVARFPDLSVNRYIRWAYSGILAAALGAEAWFIWIQHAVIQSWCPVCLAIASVVLILCLLNAIEISISNCEPR